VGNQKKKINREEKNSFSQKDRISSLVSNDKKKKLIAKKRILLVKKTELVL
jgi:hypothetical protein